MKYLSGISRATKIAVLLTVIFIAGGASWYWHHHHAAQTASLTHQAGANNTASAPTPPTPPGPEPKTESKAAGPSASQLELAFVAKHSGKGIEWAFIRQLVADPGSWGFTGNQDDAKAVKQWAGHEAAVICYKSGYCEWKFGAEVQTYGGVAYVLQKDVDGKIQVAEYPIDAPPTAATSTTTTNSNNSNTRLPAAIHALSASVAASQFFGASPVTGNKLPVPHYEYVDFPGE